MIRPPERQQMPDEQHGFLRPRRGDETGGPHRQTNARPSFSLPGFTPFAISRELIEGVVVELAHLAIQPLKQPGPAKEAVGLDQFRACRQIFFSRYGRAATARANSICVGRSSRDADNPRLYSRSRATRFLPMCGTPLSSRAALKCRRVRLMTRGFMSIGRARRSQARGEHTTRRAVIRPGTRTCETGDGITLTAQCP